LSDGSKQRGAHYYAAYWISEQTFFVNLFVEDQWNFEFNHPVCILTFIIL
jgi:hypothetical protein